MLNKILQDYLCLYCNPEPHILQNDKKSVLGDLIFILKWKRKRKQFQIIFSKMKWLINWKSNASSNNKLLP